ncbi:aminotransferase class V-fold PLP-dependent enzyme [Ohtaekwangia kribbensis]|uniref:Aminotransferase class V-fold PLP-dependent enzyme n=1 Tax=Ohtaekwangia kribbensis TaxID=688913 RepID=A0ABW3JZJ6_9BACT
MPKRRDVLKQISTLPLLGGLAASVMPLDIVAAPRHKDYFKELGIRTFINAAGTYTSMTGSLMADEVVEGIQYASKEYVLLDELQDKVGERIATLLHCEAATVTSGAASAITLATAGILSGMDEKKAAMIPHLEGSGMKTEVIMQKAHDIVYAHALRNCGVKVIFVETRAELEKAINSQTALMFFVNANNFEGKIRAEEFVEVARKYSIPTINDCAADVPPVENLWKYTRMGFDLVCFSGGKGIRGPQSAGLLLGRKDLVAAARLSAPPRGNTVGRCMKVNKEEILGMLIALEVYLARDHAQEWKMWEAQIAVINDAIKLMPGVETKIDVPPIANHIPTLNVSWNTKQVKLSGDELKEKLRTGHPSIEVAGGGANSVSITTWMLVPGQERIVASRLREALLKAAV